MNVRDLRCFVLFAVLALLTSACPGPAYPKCENDAQCKKDGEGKPVVEYCLFGQCARCAKDENCEAGQRCNRGRCDKACTEDAQCGTGQICGDSGCEPAQCTEAKACPAGLACKNGRCGSATTSAPTAASSAPGALVCDRRQTVHFDFNIAELRPDARSVLDNLAKCFQQDASWSLTVEGHCDERGTTEYNLQLGERRARVIREYLERLGVAKKRIKTISFGKERPLDPSSSEAAWEKNRRGELIFQ